MFIAHLPAGYLVVHALWPRLRPQAYTDETEPPPPQRGSTPAPAAIPKTAMAVALVASIAPDLDLLWFYGVDGGQTHHHHFFPHLPFLWGVAGGFGVVLLTLLGQPRARRLFALGIACGLVHLVLDTLVGHIKWLWPFSQNMMAMVTVPATEQHWIFNFVLHWTFGVEIAICGAAIAHLLWRRREGLRASTPTRTPMPEA